MASTNLLCALTSTLFLFSFLLPWTLGVTPSSTVEEFLTSHNKVRAKHSLPPLRWSNNLAKYAKWYSEKRRGDCKLVHSVLNFGENMFWGEGTRWKPSDAVAAWAAQELWYNYKTVKCMPNKKCTHYTQVVWRTTTRVGCAKIKCNSGDTLIICEYDPHGNIIGQPPY